MAWNNHPDRQGHVERSHPPEHKLSHRMSNISDITDVSIDHFQYDQPTIRSRESEVSLQSYYDSPSTAQEPFYAADLGYSASPLSWAGPFSSSHGGYEAVSVSGETPSRTNSKYGNSASRAYSIRRQKDAIPEEDYDLAILPAAAPMGRSSPYGQVPGHEPIEPAFDPTSSLGPLSLQDDFFVKKLQEQEASGKLTGGLGVGAAPKPGTRLLGSELLRAPTRLHRTLTRTLSRRPDYGPAAAIRNLGQDEANRRGEVIEVVMDDMEDDPRGVDISAMVGPETLDADDDEDEIRRSVLPVTKKKTHVFYPQPNWKPFSMRWPYLTSLIVISFALAIMQEVLYQKSVREPLLKFNFPTDVPAEQYFAVKFVPTLLSVSYGVLWQVTDFEVKRLEAFYQMSKPGGALAAESINVDYVTSGNLMRPLRALKLKHYAVAVCSVATALSVSLVPTFSAASLFLTPDRQARIKEPDSEKAILMHPVWSRFLTATLVFCAFCGCALFYLLQTRRSGLVADVRGIAGLASMAVVSHMLMDFKDMDTAKHQDIHHKLKYHRYVLRNSSLSPDDENPVSTQEEDKFQHAHLSENPHPLMLRASGCIPFIVGIALLMGFIPAFLFTKATVVTDKAPWVVTALAVCVKLTWGSMDKVVRMMEPFYILSNRHAPSVTLTLDYTAMPFGYLPFKAFFNNHVIVFLVGAGSVIVELLTVLLTSLATVDGRQFVGLGDGNDHDEINAGQETPMSFFVSLALAIFILLYLAIVTAVVFARRRHPFLPRQPNTIASILAYIHQSRMLYDFVDTSKLSNPEMVQKLEQIGKTYGLGYTIGRDGQTHCGVDQEELIGNYKHGREFGQVNKPWVTQWEVF